MENVLAYLPEVSETVLLKESAAWRTGQGCHRVTFKTIVNMPRSIGLPRMPFERDFRDLFFINSACKHFNFDS